MKDTLSSPSRTIWWDGDAVAVIDQRALPHELTVARWHTVDDAAGGIADMTVRGAPLIGVAAAHGLALAAAADPSDESLAAAARALAATRPTAVNLRWALDRCVRQLLGAATSDRAVAARLLATQLADEDVAACRSIGEFGVQVIDVLWQRHRRPLNILTHCNAGWLACVEWGTATAPMYLAHQRGVPIHVWVSETRPRNQGASLTTWELSNAGIPHELVVDNAAAHLMHEGLVDVVIVGADRVAANGDAANKIGTALKAYAAAAVGVPFYVAAPWSTIDLDCPSGREIPIEERSADEVLAFAGTRIAPPATTARNWGFDVTPASLIAGIVTETGIVPPAGLRDAR